jgi:protein TonB
MSKLLSALVLSLVYVSAMAADVPPSLDPKQCTFTYPKAALMNEEQGISTVKVTVDAVGKVTKAELLSSSGSKTLDKATVSVVNTCKFIPGTKDGKTAEATTTIKYEWSLTK